MILKGNCLDTLKTLPDCSVDRIVTDPPYELGFMGKSWDNSGIAYNQDLWAECLRVLKPGGHLLAFSGSRTYHRMVVAIEDSGFEIRDQIMWIYGSGFPKSLDVSKAIDKLNGRMFDDRYALGKHIKERRTRLNITKGQVNEWLGSSTKCEHYESTSDGFARVPTSEDYQILKKRLGLSNDFDELVARIEAEREVVGTKTSGIANKNEAPRHTIGASKSIEVDITAPATPEAQQWQGWGTALKPAHEPIVVARKPLIGTVANNVLTYGTGALNIDGSRVGTTEKLSIGSNNRQNALINFGMKDNKETQEQNLHGRWPANVIHDGSDEVLAGFPNEAGRFFFNTKSDYNEGLWLDLNLHPNPAKNAETSSSLPNQSGDSVLVHALNLALPEGLRCVGLSVELSTTVTANESKRIVEAVMQMTQSIGARFLPESEQPKLTLSSNHAKVVGTLEPTGIMTITASHWKSDGYAEPVTFSITPENSEHGARDSNGKSFIYCAKASKSERNAGLELCTCDKLSPWEKVGQQVAHQTDTEPLAPRDTEESGIQNNSDSEWNTSLSGSDTTEPCLTDCKSITLTTTNSTTTSVISNLSAQSNISVCTQGANCETECGGNRAKSADNSSQSPMSIGTSAERDGLVTADANLATSALLSQVSAKGVLFCARCDGLKGGHPTVKPLALMRYLIKLVTPPGGTVLDPFLGSGTTAVAAILEGFEWIGCEMTEDYFPIIEARVVWAENQPKTLI